MTAGQRELVAGTAASTTFLLLFLLTPIPILLAAGLASGMYLGSRLLIREHGPKKLTDGFEELVRTGLSQSERFLVLASAIKNEAIQERVKHVGERLGRIFQELAHHPQNTEKARLFVTLYLPKTIELIEVYIRLTALTGLNDEDRQRIQEMETTINMAADALKELHRQMSQEDVMEFDAANGTLQQILRMETDYTSTYASMHKGVEE
ncbi:5-bromo-4-chloroindolyl phosphate hydrolysis family protein [Candidatus Uhrbacteria bacterium]|nr:5-bromo-4-chloroindolyl phosphate hydrolysis family protein [Candidatus Uhrbacteria bacterium]